MMAFREFLTLRELSCGAAPRLAAARLCLETGVDWIQAFAVDMLREAAQLEPERADVIACLGWLELVAGRGGPDAVLARWRRARELEPELFRFPAGALAAFTRDYGQRPELDEIVPPRAAR
jgi:hypothetical protein